MTVTVEERPGATRISAPAYLLEVRTNPPRAVLADADGRIWSQLSLLASLDRTDAPDESHAVGVPEVATTDGGARVRVRAASTAWETKEVVLECTPEAVELTVSVTGTGTLATATLLGGNAVLANGACGRFRSSTEFRSVFTPNPTEPVQVVRAADSGAVLGVVGDAGPGRLHAVFSPPPLCLVLGRQGPGAIEDRETPDLAPSGPPRRAETSELVRSGPTGSAETSELVRSGPQMEQILTGREGEAAEGPGSPPAWLALSVRAGIDELTFTQLRYDAVDGGFHLELDYDGHTRVAGGFTTPPLVLRPAADPWAALADHRDDLVARGMAPRGPVHPRAGWWQEPIFCGWGAQCARAPLPGAPAGHPFHLDELGPAVVPPGLPIGPDLARQDVYDELLDHLAAHGIVPGTVVIDDKWQAEYGTAEPDTERWPDLRAWIAAAHARGRRVLLWWKAWDPQGLPAEECVRDARGVPVAADPGNPAYRERLRRTMAGLLGPGGLGADGLKVDFTQRAPAGTSLTGAGGPWGIAGLHLLLRTLYEAAKEARADALVITHTPNPLFADVCDMVRLNDVLELDPAGRLVPVVDQLEFRAAVARAALPHHLVDTDQWPMPDRAQWRAYAGRQGDLGVPALYYAERMDRTLEDLTADDLALVARSWADYRARVAADPDPPTFDPTPGERGILGPDSPPAAKDPAFGAAGTTGGAS